MTDTPTAALTTAPEAPPPAFKLFSVKHILWGSLFGGPLVATLMMAANFKRLGEIKKSRVASLIGAGTVAIVVFLSFYIEKRFGRTGNLSFAGAFGAAARGAAKHYQGSALEAHEGAGGRMESAWKSLGVTVLGMLQTLIGAAVVVGWLQTTVVFGGSHDIVLEGDATESDARRVGNVLTEVGVFRADQQTEMTLAHRRSTWTLTFTLSKSGAAPSGLASSFAPAGQALREQVFNLGEKLQIEFLKGFGIKIATCDVDGSGGLSCR